MKLVSDFTDYYDTAFLTDNSDLEFHRMSTGGMDKKAQLDYLEVIGFRVPLRGTVREVYEKLEWECFEFSGRVFRKLADQLISVVVYTDMMAHCGEGKKLMYLRDARKECPDLYCTQYIPTLDVNIADTIRYLQIGNQVCWIRYISCDDWRSNCGETECILLHREPRGERVLTDFPLVAIDLIPSTHLYAIDVNISPQIAGTGLEELLHPKKAVELIKEKLMEKKQKC